MLRWMFIALLFILVACGGTPSADTSQNANTQPTVIAENVQTSMPIATTASSEGLVARVNGVGISQLTFDKEYARRAEGLTMADPNALAQQVLDGLIEREIVRQYARNNGVVVTLDAARAEVDALKASIATDEEWQNFLAINDMTEPEMINAQLEQLVTAKVREQLFAPMQGDVPQAHARHIVVKTENEANSILAQLQNGGNFEELARNYSIDLATRENSGDLGWFSRGELIDDRLAEVIFSLQPGAIAGPIPTRIGYHVVQLIETANRPIESQRMPLLLEAIYNKWLFEQIERATIERFR
jgi:parvulin-like peptidyl-prolyl isomerase